MSATQRTRQLAVTTPLGEDALLLSSFTGVEKISEPFTYQLEMLSEHHSIQPGDLIGSKVTFTAKQVDGSLRYFNGFIRDLKLGHSTSRRRGLLGRLGSKSMEQFRRYSAEVVPWLWFLTRTADCRVFQDKTVPEIIEQIFREHGFADFETAHLKESYEKRGYCVQYNETDFNFISRLMEEEGIFYFFRHENDRHVLVLADQTTAYYWCQQRDVRYHHDSTMQVSEEGITNWEVHHAFRSSRVTHTAFNYENPSINMIATERTVADDPWKQTLELYQYTEKYETPADGRQRARVHMEQEEVGLHTALAASTCRFFAPGGKFTIRQLPFDDDQTWVVTSVEHHAIEPSAYETGEGSDNTYTNKIVCIQESIKFRPSRRTPRALAHGPQTAKVVGPEGEEIYTDQYGRVKVQFHWDREGKRDENSSCWIRVAQVHAGKGWGAIDVPRIGEEVIVDFMGQDPDRPIVIGRVYNANHQPPFQLPAGKATSGMKSNSTIGGGGFNQFSFDDTKGSERITIRAEKDESIVIQNDKDECVKHDETLTVDNNRARQVGADESVHVAGNRVVSVDTHTEMWTGKTVKIMAGEEIKFQVGAATIFMNADGTIVLDGTNILIRGSDQYVYRADGIVGEANSSHEFKGAVVKQNC